MKTIVIIFFPRWQDEASEAVPDRTLLCPPGEKDEPPFWTWFIENPPGVRAQELTA